MSGGLQKVLNTFFVSRPKDKFAWYHPTSKGEIINLVWSRGPQDYKSPCFEQDELIS